MTEATARQKFQNLIESVESLSIEDREMFVEIINKRIIEQRRDELLADMKASMDEYSRGEARSGSVDDLLKDLEEGLSD